MERPRRETRPVQVGDVQIGGDAPVSVQSMTTTKTHDVEATLDEIERIAEAGGDIVRVAVPRPEDADALADLVQGTDVPLVADIHFNYQYALKAIEAGVDKVRINPGNIGKPEWEREVLEAAKEAGLPIRIGVNSGSLEETSSRSTATPSRRPSSRARCATWRSATRTTSRTSSSR
jgi:(E)-4-hydroxy-3-methylbut-2-enyl-diphosphate synthase